MCLYLPFYLLRTCPFYFNIGERQREIEREGEHKWEGQRKREKENPKKALHCWSRARHGAGSHEPQDDDLSQNQELKAQSIESCRCPILRTCSHPFSSSKPLAATCLLKDLYSLKFITHL